MSSTELYERLGVTKEASSSEIRASYRKLVLLHHPDKNPEGDAAVFHNIQEAYEVLSDDSKKATYDATGRVPGQRDDGAGQSAAESDSFFEQMFGYRGGGGPGRGPAHFSTNSQPPKKRKGKQQTVPLEVSLEDLHALKTYNFNVKRKVLCRSCKGSGATPGAAPKECVQCQGYGQTRSQVAVGPGVMKSQWNVCQNCNGSGTRFRSRDRCKKCEGAKSSEVRKPLTVQLEAGHTDGSHILIEGAGDEEYNAEKPGDLLFIVALQPHPTFRLVPHSGFDLECDATMTLSELLLGFDRVVTVHLDGRHLEVKHQGTIDPGSKSRILIKGEGLLTGRPAMPHRTSSGVSGSSSTSRDSSRSKKGSTQARGDLWICVQAEESLAQWIETLSAEQKEQLTKLLPPKRPALDVEPNQLCKCTNAVVLTGEEAEKAQEPRPKPHSSSSGQSRNFTRGPDGYMPSESADMDCKPS